MFVYVFIKNIAEMSPYIMLTYCSIAFLDISQNQSHFLLVSVKECFKCKIARKEKGILTPTVWHNYTEKNEILI